MSEQIEGVPEGWRLIRITNIPKIGEYALSCAGRVVRVSDPDEWDIACIVERIEPPKPKYRPFVNAVEFMNHPLANDWINAGGEYFEKVTTCTNSGITFDDCELYSYQRALHELKFSDGTPFGVEVKE